MQFPGVHFRAFEAVVDFLYPPLCLLCPAQVGSRIESVCPACRSSIREIDDSHEAWTSSEHKLLHDGLVEGLHSLFLFEKKGPLQRALHLLKYGGMHSLGERFGRELGGSLSASGRIPSVDVVVPVPLHGAKFRERGYNQSEKICRGIEEVTGLKLMPYALARTRNTPSQTTLSLHEREANVRDAFSVVRGMEKSLRGKTILLVDDVLTTGATLRSCARALKGARTGAIICATVAIAP